MPYTNVDDIKIHYEVEGAGPPLLLIAGLAGDLHAWDRQIADYAARYTCVLVDNRGAGRSDAPAAGYSTGRFADDALAVMDSLGIERFHAAGQSMGGAIVQELMLAVPQRVISASIHCSWARCDGHLAAIFQAWETVRRACTLAEYDVQVMPWLLSATTYARDPGFVARVRADMDATDTPQSAEAFSAQARACIEHDAFERLADCDVPTLVMVGAEDIFTPRRFSHALHEQLPNSELRELPGLGHCLFFEAPDQFNQQTIDFMSQFDLRQEHA